MKLGLAQLAARPQPGTSCLSPSQHWSSPSSSRLLVAGSLITCTGVCAGAVLHLKRFSFPGVCPWCVCRVVVHMSWLTAAMRKPCCLGFLICARFCSSHQAALDPVTSKLPTHNWKPLGFYLIFSKGQALGFLHSWPCTFCQYIFLCWV